MLLFMVAFMVVGGCVDIRTPDPAVMYVAFGDSTTRGPSSRDYPDILRETLGVPAEAFANEGLSGETSGEGVTRLKGLIDAVIYPNARVLLYWEGGKDLTEFIEDHDPFLLFSPAQQDYPFDQELVTRLDEVRANVEAAIFAGRQAGLRVYVATYFFLRQGLQFCDALPFNILLPGQAVNGNAYLVRLNEQLRAAVESGGAVLVDVAVSETIPTDAANYYNCSHLSAAGNEIVADLFADAILRGEP